MMCDAYTEILESLFIVCIFWGQNPLKDVHNKGG